MNLVQVYEKYKAVNDEYSKFIENLINSDFIKENEISKKLDSYNNTIQCLKVDADSIESEDKDNLNDLNYLIMDLIFLSIDLINFYNYKEVERFKMRATNYVNKQRRKELFTK